MTSHVLLLTLQPWLASPVPLSLRHPYYDNYMIQHASGVSPNCPNFVTAEFVFQTHQLDPEFTKGRVLSHSCPFTEVNHINVDKYVTYNKC